MKVLVTGGNGQLAYDVKKDLAARGIAFISVDREDADITNEQEIKACIEEHHPDAVLHCAAYTAVDKAEDDAELAYQINVLGTRYIAQACKAINAKMIYISTDYIFNGQGEQEFEIDDPAGPLSVYGKTKYEGECEVREILEHYFIVRISWVFGVGGANFVKTMLRLGRERPSITVVDDQYGSPTYTEDVAHFLGDLIQTDKYGTYHATNEGVCSWYEFTQEIFKIAGIACEVKPISSKDYPAKAVRPTNSRLSKRTLDEQGFTRLPKWQNALQRMIQEISKEN